MVPRKGSVWHFFFLESGVTDPSSIVIMNLDNFVHRALEVIRKHDGFIDEKQGVHSIDPTDGASAEHP